jgi:hypothetical protein
VHRLFVDGDRRWMTIADVGNEGGYSTQYDVPRRP